MLYESVTSGIHVCATVELISSRIENNKTEDYTHKYNGRPFRQEKKLYKGINITVVESTENVYHVTRQNLYFPHASYSKNKN